VLSVPWTGVTGTAVKGILHSPSATPTTSLDRRAELLLAIAKSAGLDRGAGARFAIAEGSLAGHLNATKLVKSMDCSWAEQERRICGDA
jgi:hypothetical protein